MSFRRPDRRNGDGNGNEIKDRERKGTMRKVIVQELMSVDGFVADTDGGLDFFEAAPDFGEVDRDNLAMMQEADTVLLGRTTYGLFVDFWPTAEGEPVAEMVNTTPKVVFSSTLGRAPWGRWEPARVVRGDAAGHVRDLKSQPGQNMIVWGSISLAQSLLRAGLVDEVWLTVLPTLLGTGRSFGAEGIGGRAGVSGSGGALTLREAKPYGSGIVSLRYAVAAGG